MGMFDQENAGLSDPAAQKEAQRIVSYRDQRDTPGYEPPEQPQRVISNNDVYDPDAGAMVPNTGGPGTIIGQAFNALGGAARGVFQSMAENTNTGYTAPGSVGIAPSATAPRTPGVQTRDTLQAGQFGLEDRGGATNPYVSQPDASSGPVTTAANAGPQGPQGPQGLGGTMAPYTPPPGTPTVQNYRDQLGQQELRDSFRQANDARQLQERNHTQINQANAADATMAAQTATREAQVARFQAKNGADMVLAAGNPAYAGQRKAIRDIAAATAVDAQNANRAAGDANAAVGKPLGNPVDDFFKSQEGLQRGQQGLATAQQTPIEAQLKQQQLQAGQQHIDLGKLDVASKKRIDDIGTQLADRNLDPKKASQLHSTLLALLGKDKPEDYKIIHAPGASHADPTTGAVTKEPDSVIIANQRDGTYQVLPIGQQSKAAAPPENHVLALKQDPKNAQLRAQFDAKYGKGAADQYAPQ
jgi:hypothetical protein